MQHKLLVDSQGIRRSIDIRTLSSVGAASTVQTCQPFAIALLCGLLLQSLVGCARWDCNSRRSAWETELRTLADVACRTQFGEAGEGPSCNTDYREGWMEGYYQVLGGRSGQPPVVPASQYWEPEARHANNLHRVGDWQRGFTDGAAAAHSCGQYGYATVPAAAPPPPMHQDRPIYTVDCFTSLAPDGMLNAPARELPPMPMPLPPTLEQLDGRPNSDQPPELQHTPDSDDLLPSPSDLSSDLPGRPDGSREDSDALLLGATQPNLDAALARLRTASNAMRQASTVIQVAQRQPLTDQAATTIQTGFPSTPPTGARISRAPRRLPIVDGYQPTGTLR